jgi:hypothetical protein
MEMKVKKSLFAGIPAWVLSVLISVATIIYVFIQDHFSMKRELAGQARVFIGPVRLNEFIDFIVFIIIIPFTIFLICRKHPKSVWYTPVLGNAFGLGMGITVMLSFIFDWDPLSLSDWIIWGGTFMLTIIVAIVGARVGRKLTNQAK